MSIRSVRAAALLKLGASLLALVAVVAVTWCVARDQNSGSPDEPDKYFLRDVATAQAMDLPVYWLGWEFTVDGLVFRGPYGSGIGPEVERAAIDMTYLAPLDGGNAAFDLTVYSRDVWDLAKERVSNPGLPGVTRRMVTVGDREAELISVPLGARPVNILWLVLDLGDVVVLATAPSGAPNEPPNPLMNPDNLIALMQDLRPYPE